MPAKLYGGDDSPPMRAKKTFRDDGDDEPQFASLLDVDFQSEHSDRASLGRSGIKRFEVTLEP